MLESRVAMLRGGGIFKGWSLAGGSKGVLKKSASSPETLAGAESALYPPNHSLAPSLST